MSCDILGFDKSKAPKTSREFEEWFKEKSKWSENRDYFDIKGTTKPLVDFFMELNQIFPEMNGPYSPTEEVINNNPDINLRLADYTIGSDLIYVGFPWSLAGEAENKVRELAFKYGLGVSDMVNIYWDENNSEKLIIPKSIKAKNKKSTKRIIINILCSILFIVGVIFSIFYYITDSLVYGIIAIVFMLIGSIIGIKSDKIK